MLLVFDIGGTKMRLAVSDDETKIDNSITVATPRNFEEGMNTFQNVLKNLTGEERVEKSAGGVRALDKTKSTLLDHPHFPLWVGKPLKEALEKIIGTEVFLENDAAMAGLGEASTGAGKDLKIVAYVTVSTGVGGAKIVEKKIDPTFQGFEPGNMIIDADGSFKSVSGFGYLESYISGFALEEKFGKKCTEIDDPEVWEEIAKILAYGLNNIAVMWSPEAIILGGSLMHKIPLPQVEYHLSKVLKIFPEPPKIVKAELGDLAGLHGALEYLKTI